jgi:hypothetical protein
MGIKNQFDKIKENWLLLLVVVVIMGVFMFSGSTGSLSGVLEKSVSSMGVPSMGMVEADYAYTRGMPVQMGGAFAPDVTERKITKTASLSTEVKRGQFKEAESRFKAIIQATDSFLLDENVNKYGKGRGSYLQGWYQVKVETNKYDAVISQLKDIGEVQSFSENMQDITGSYTNTEIELSAETERLKRFQDLYNNADKTSDKLELTDRIFNQERRVKYLEDSLTNLDRRVDYSTVSVSLTEERSGYANLALVKFSELVTKLVGSFNSVLSLVFWVIPWAIITGIVWIGVRYFRRRH